MTHGIKIFDNYKSQGINVIIICKKNRQGNFPRGEGGIEPFYAWTWGPSAKNFAEKVYFREKAQLSNLED